MKFLFNDEDSTWECHDDEGMFEIHVCEDGSFDASYTDDKTLTQIRQKATELVFTLRQAIEWCERYETTIYRKRRQAHARS